VSINTLDVDVSGQVLTPGDGVTTGDVVHLPIDVHVPVADLRNEFDNNTGSPGTFDPGSNRLFAQAVDGQFNTTYDNLIFSVGPVAPAPGSSLASQVQQVGRHAAEVTLNNVSVEVAKGLHPRPGHQRPGEVLRERLYHRGAGHGPEDRERPQGLQGHQGGGTPPAIPT